MQPIAFAPRFALFGRSRLGGVALEPAAHVEIIILLRPDHARERLALHEPRILARKIALQSAIEFIGLGQARGEDRVEIGKGGIGLGAGLTRSQAKRGAGSRRELELHMGCAFRAPVAPDGLLVSRDDEIIDAILEGAGGLDAEEPPHIGLVLAEEERARPVDGKLAIGHAGMVAEHLVVDEAKPGLLAILLPRPGIAGEKLRKKMQARPSVRPIDDRDTHQNVFGVALAYSTVTSK